LNCMGTFCFSVLLVMCTLPPWMIAKVGLVCNVLCPSCKGSRRLRAISLAVCMSWRLLLLLTCCWVRMRVDGLREFRRTLGKSGRPCVLVANHLSFLDTILVVSFLPLSMAAKLKMLVSSHLLEVPALRTLIRTTRHIVVPFKRARDHDAFEVDKELMAARQIELEEHVRAGGIAAWFPEGRLNAGDPFQLERFRHGGFALPARVDVEIWCIAFVGNGECWPRTAAVGGKPSRLRARIFRLCESSWAAAGVQGGDPGEHDERVAAAQLADAARKGIQAAIWELAPSDRIGEAASDGDRAACDGARDAERGHDDASPSASTAALSDDSPHSVEVNVEMSPPARKHSTVLAVPMLRD